MQVDLRAVERSLALADLVLELVVLQRLLQRALGAVPLLVGTEPLFRTSRQFGVWDEAEEVVQVAGEVHHPRDLVLDLILGDEHVRVVLRDVLDAQQAVQGSALLVAVESRRLGEPQRQLAVAAQARAEEQHVARAVHRLEREAARALLVADDPEDVLLVVLEVARRLVRVLVVEERGLHLEVAATAILAPAQVLERVPDHHALRVPERRPRRHVVQVEEVELDAEPAVVAPLRLLDPFEVRVEVGARVERGPVDPGQLLVVLVAAPVRTGQAGELHRLDRLRVLEMRPPAEVGEVALGVEADLPLGGVHELELVGLVAEPLPRLVGAALLARPLPALLQLPVDLVLDPLEIVLVDRLGELEVVVEAVLDRRADRDLHSRIEVSRGLGEQVRGRVPQDRERVGILAVAGGQDLDLLPVGERQS